MSKKLLISKTLSLPLDAVTQKLAYLGRTGSGKTFGCKRTVEQMLRCKAQVVILDGSGGWAGLRLGPKAFKIPVFGGLHGDIPLESSAGELVANLIVDRGISVVLDVSQMLDAERTRFATAFAKRFFQRKKASPSAVHVVLEECQDFVPENCQRGEEQMLHEFQRLAKQGRPHGIGISFISQRPQEISKKALNQAECVFAFQMNGPHERKALQYWLSDKGFEGKLADVLPTLEIGAPYVWSPQWLKISKIVRILPIDSLDTSATPKVGGKAFKQKKLTPIDMKSITIAMAETVERAKADDPRLLRAEIAKLKAELSKKQVPTSTPTKIVQVPTTDGETVAAIGKILPAINQARMSLSSLSGAITGAEALVKSAEAQARKALGRKTLPAAVKKLVAESKDSYRPPYGKNTTKANGSIAKPYASIKEAHDEMTLPTGERSIMIAVAQNPDGASRELISLATGYKTSTRNAYLQRLDGKGFVEAGTRGLVVATQAGLEALGSDYEPLPTGRALLEHWLKKLPQGEQEVLRVVAEAYPDAVGRDVIGESTGYKTSTRNAYLQRLGTRRLVIGRGEIQLSEELVG